MFFVLKGLMINPEFEVITNVNARGVERTLVGDAVRVDDAVQLALLQQARAVVLDGCNHGDEDADGGGCAE